MEALKYREAEDLTPDQKSTIQRRAASELARRGIPGIVTYVIALLVLAVATPFAADLPIAVYSVAALLAVGGATRGLLLWRFESLYDRNRKIWHYGYLFGVWTTALAWGVLNGIAVYEYAIAWTSLLTTLMTAGMCAGGLTSLNMRLPLLRGFLALMLAPPLLASLATPKEHGLSLAFAFVAYLVYMLIQGRHMHREYWTALINSVRLDAETKQRLHELTYHDPLTRLANRTLFNDRLRQALADARRHSRMVGVMSLDLDRFKNVNDTLGHEAGDLLLRETATRLNQTLRDGDTISRLGADEFALVLPNPMAASDLAKVANKLIDAISRPFTIADLELFVTVSIGIAVFPRDATTPDALLANATAARIRAAQHGGNGFHYYHSEMNAQMKDRLALESGLRNALARDEFLLHYQPKVELATGRMTGVEALLRWQPAGRNLVSPAQFIPALEDTGLIVPVGEWVLRKACQQNKAWQVAGHAPVRMAVNLSARQFRDPKLPATVSQALDDADLDARWLELEITESMLMEDNDRTAKVLNRLADMGVHLSIDDFGTGYSSLAYLKRMPIHTLKIDRSFVADVNLDANDAAVVQAVIAMAHNLKLSVVAEGAETVEQVGFLRDQGCDEMQGYFFSRPMPAPDLRPMLESGRCRDTSEIRPRAAPAVKLVN